MACYLAFKRKDILTHLTICMNPEDIILSAVNQTKGQIWHDSIYTRDLEQSNAQRQRAAWWVLGAGKKGEWGVGV